MNASITLGRLLADVYDRYARYGAGGIDFFAPHCEAMLTYDPSEVVAQQVKAYPLLYVADFLLSCPDLLSAMDTDAWSRAMVAAGPRPELRAYDIQMEQMSDVYFICKFLRLDAVRFAIDRESMPLEDKHEILRKAQLSSPLLVLDDLDREELDGIRFVSEAFLRETADRLYAEGGWSRLPNTREGIIEQLRGHR